MVNQETLQPVNQAGNIVEIKDAVIMQEDNIVLRDVNIEIKEGEFVYLIGRVGSGKSSFLKTLYSEIPFDGATGFVVGYDLDKIKRSQIPYLRRRVGVIFQDFQLLSDRNVYDNLSFVLRATGWKQKNLIDKRIREVLSQVDMVEKGYRMPHQLSGGEQQRIAVARALLNKPSLILADEPTGNLDPETTDSLMRLLIDINKAGTTIIMATHNYGVIRKFQMRTLKFENSMVSEFVNEGIEIDFDL